MSNISNNSPHFGMALHMKPKSKLAKKVGSYAASEAEKVRPQLKELANDVEMYVKPYTYFKLPFSSNITTTSFKIRVHEKFENIKNPVKRFLYKHGILTPPYVERGSSFITNDNLAESIIKTAKETKEDFKRIR